MIEKILKALEISGVKLYRIVESKVESVELFFVKKDLDMNRKKVVSNYDVTVYNDFTVNDINYRGEASVKVHPNMEINEMVELFKDGLYSAGFVMNKYYPLVKGCKEEHKVMESNFSNCSLEEGAEKLRTTIYSEDNYDNGGINSCEIFLNKNNKRIINSEGVDVSYDSYSSEIECITQWKENDDVEIFNLFKQDELKEEFLKNQVKDGIEVAKWRDKAKETPDTGKYTVILSHEAAKELFNYYIMMTNANSVYGEISNFKVGDPIQGKAIKGDKVTINLVAKLPYDGDGFKLKDVTIVEDGIVKAIHGSQRFCSYIGVEPTGNISNVKVELGSKSLDEMKKENCLHLTTFSGFQLASLAGDFAGEIRLGFLYKDGKVTPITGGSISFNLKNMQENMILSKDVLKDDWYDGPLAVQIFDVNVAGK